MQKTILILAGLFTVGCLEIQSAVLDAGKPSAPEEQPAVAFSVHGPDKYGFLDELLPESLARWSTATCVKFRIAEGQHTLSYGDKTNMVKGRLGQTTGEWDAAIIRVKDIIEGPLRIVITHEIAHVLARSNDHAVDGVYAENPYSQGIITQGTLDKVCDNLDCKCKETELP